MDSIIIEDVVNNFSSNGQQMYNENKHILQRELALKLEDIEGGEAHCSYCSKKFVIEINENYTGNIFEEIFLHEFWHCVQVSQGFPTVEPKDNKDKDSLLISNEISSAILDINIANTFRLYRIKETPDTMYKAKMGWIKKLSRNSVPAPFVDEYDKLSKQTALHMINLVFSNIPKYQKEAVEKELYKYRQSLLFRYYKIVKTIIKRCDVNTPEGCLQIFTDIIKELQLTDKLTIITDALDGRTIIDKDCPHAKLIEDAYKFGLLT